MKKECPFCKASLEEDMTYCPECGMDLPEEEVSEGSMDEEPDVEDLDTPEIDISGSGMDMDMPAADLEAPDDELGPDIDDPIEPPSMEEGP